MHKINSKNQYFIDLAGTYGIDLQKLRKTYNLAAALKLFKKIKKLTEKGKDELQMFPPPEKEQSRYITSLKDAGFKIREWKEDFVDEDTGEVVSIPRFAVLALSLK